MAKHVLELNADLKDNYEKITELIESSTAAPLLEVTGAGPVIEAVVCGGWAHLGRVRTEATFAALAGVDLITASSGDVERLRLNRGGGPRLNSALHMATIVRTIHDPDTRTYAERRKSEGKSSREVRRILKRYFARPLYRLLIASHSLPDGPISAC